MIKKKLVKVGDSRAVIIPNSYLDYWQLKGKKILGFELEVNKKLILAPILEDIEKGDGDAS